MKEDFYRNKETVTGFGEVFNLYYPLGMHLEVETRSAILPTGTGLGEVSLRLGE